MNVVKKKRKNVMKSYVLCMSLSIIKFIPLSHVTNPVVGCPGRSNTRKGCVPLLNLRVKGLNVNSLGT